MSRDEAVSVALVVAFASWVTAHVSLSAGLAAQPPRWRALVALVLPPLAPVWGRGRMRVRVSIWVASAVLYLGLLWLARR
jgi:hypothetical protein